MPSKIKGTRMTKRKKYDVEVICPHCEGEADFMCENNLTKTEAKKIEREAKQRGFEAYTQEHEDF